MLKYTVNNRNIKIHYKNINCLSIIQDEQKATAEFFVDQEDLSFNELTLSFNRDDGIMGTAPLTY